MSIPSLLLVRFPEYSGPDFPLYGSKVVPLFPVTCHFGFKGVARSRTQFLLHLAYAIYGLQKSGFNASAGDRKRALPTAFICGYLAGKGIKWLMFESSFNFSRFTLQDFPIGRDFY